MEGKAAVTSRGGEVWSQKKRERGKEGGCVSGKW